MAPDLITMDDEGCYFHRQPETPHEINRALDACIVSCIENYRYGGKDEEIRARLTEAGYGHLCDVPISRPRVIRHLARFSMPNAVDARGVVAEVANALELSHGVVSGDRDRAEYETAPHPRLDIAIHTYTVERIVPAGAVATAYRDPDPRSVWLLRGPKHSFRIHAHTKLVELGAGDVRWFSEDEYKRGASGRLLPF